MPRKSANNNVEEKPVVGTKVEETPLDEISENDSDASDLQETEIPSDTPKKKRSVFQWILSVSALILIVLFIIYFRNIIDYLLSDESRLYTLGAIGVLVIALLVWYVPKRQVKKLESKTSDDKLTEFEREEKRLKLEDDTRKTLAQIIGGAFFIAGLLVTFYTYRLGTDNYRLGLDQQKVSLQKQELDRRGQITERFNKAIGNLGNQDISVRLGGLYALEQILRDSPEDHQTIIEVLSAYIREKAKKNIAGQKNTDQTNQAKSKAEDFVSVTTDVQTALTILGRRPERKEQENGRINLSGAVLSGADFSRANFAYANFSGANLSKTSLYLANFTSAILREANLNSAHLSLANLSYTDLNSANLRYTDLNSINLSYARLYNADLSEATLIGANLSETPLIDAILNKANFTDAELTANQLEKAKFDFIVLDFDKKLDRESALKFLREKEAGK